LTTGGEVLTLPRFFMDTAVLPPIPKLAPPAPLGWPEVIGPDGRPRPQFASVVRALGGMSSSELRVLGDRMAAVLREMGVTFDLIREDPWGRHPWICDLLPHVFASDEWELLTRGFRQRLRAFEAFLADVYGKREILRSGAVPIQPVLGSPQHRAAAVGLPRPRDAFFHLSGMCVCRDAKGAWQVKHHHFSHATGISYMMQNRRALARVVPEMFRDVAVQSLAEMPLIVLEQLRGTALHLAPDPSVVLLAPASGSSLSNEHSFIARRMGIPVVAGGDLLVLDDCVYLKTVRGLDRVEVIYNHVPDEWLDPLVFRGGSLLGVPGLLQCLRRGTVSLVNAVGAQLADDRSLLAFTPQIIRFYLNEAPILPGVPTFWLGDIDQREMVLEHLEAYRIRPIYRENIRGSWDRSLPTDDAGLRAEIRKQASLFVAQPRLEGAATLCFEHGQRVEYPQDHMLFAARAGGDFAVFPGALTRVFSHVDSPGDFGVGWTSKDSWVLMDEITQPLVPQLPQAPPGSGLPPRQVTSRVAEAFYWMGRYLERAHHQAYLIGVVEALETEELNSAERRHYRPVWNRLLPPLEKSAGSSRRSITTVRDRYRLILAPDPGSVLSTFLRSVWNAESVQDSISPEGWATMSNLRSRFQRTRFREDLLEQDAARITRRLADFVTQLIPQFFGVCANTMLADDGWRFCLLGQMIERAIITANTVYAMLDHLGSGDGERSGQALEIELSAFLRLMGCRDAYRRIFQMRAEPAAVLELLWQHPEVPRSVLRCLDRCGLLLKESIDPGMNSSAPAAIEALIREIKRIDWDLFVRRPADEDRVSAPQPRSMPIYAHDIHALVKRLLDQTLEIHTHISDSFLNHQARIAQVSQPMFAGM
jgi:uncharacterized circularly permuted ATP-grasp superfamily protein/uncharacterized alpha-E superfamily protein